MTWRDMTSQHSTAQHSAARAHDMTWHSMISHGMTWYKVTWHYGDVGHTAQIIPADFNLFKQKQPSSYIRQTSSLFRKFIREQFFCFCFSWLATWLDIPMQRWHLLYGLLREWTRWIKSYGVIHHPSGQDAKLPARSELPACPARNIFPKTIK